MLASETGTYKQEDHNMDIKPDSIRNNFNPIGAGAPAPVETPKESREIGASQANPTVAPVGDRVQVSNDVNESKDANADIAASALSKAYGTDIPRAVSPTGPGISGGSVFGGASAPASSSIEKGWVFKQ